MIMKIMTLSLTITISVSGDCWKMKKSSGTGSQGNFIAIFHWKKLLSKAHLVFV